MCLPAHVLCEPLVYVLVCVWGSSFACLRFFICMFACHIDDGDNDVDDDMQRLPCMMVQVIGSFLLSHAKDSVE